MGEPQTGSCDQNHTLTRLDPLSSPVYSVCSQKAKALGAIELSGRHRFCRQSRPTKSVHGVSLRRDSQAPLAYGQPWQTGVRAAKYPNATELEGFIGSLRSVSIKKPWLESIK
jgi:hypothetical protein